MSIAVLSLAALLAVAQALPSSVLLSASKPTAGLTLTKFAWKDCGDASNALHVTNLNLSPDPITIPGNLTVSLAAALSKAAASPISADLVLKKGALKIPCIDNIGSCHYADICTLLEKIPLNPDGTCPAPLSTYKIPCRCPLGAGSWNIPNLEIAIPKPKSIPSWLTNGDYSVAATLNAGGAQLLCLDVSISLHTN
eukprot:m.220008 g.220008  ORF g.220008 m.220008 type:complete len:196 (+) comp10293_c0_seq1:2502-3089(+)